MISTFQEHINTVLKSFSIKFTSLEHFKFFKNKINNINMLLKGIRDRCIFIHSAPEDKNKFYTDIFEKKRTTIINEKAEIYENYEPAIIHTPLSINNEMIFINGNISLQNNPVNKIYIRSDKKMECETKKTPLERAVKFLDIILKFLNLSSWFLEFLFQGLNKKFRMLFLKIKQQENVNTMLYSFLLVSHNF